MTVGEGSPVKKLRHSYSTKAEAKRAAQSKLDEIKRGKSTLRISMRGDPLLAAEGRLLAIGLRAGVDGLWSITSVRHELRANGFTTQIEAEESKPKTS